MNFSEKKFIIIIGIIIFAFNLAPYLYQPLYNPPDKSYIGSFPILTDLPTYLAKMAQGEEGNWLIMNRFTSEPHTAAPLYIFYILLGQIAGFFNWPLSFVFLASRFIFGFLFFLSIIYFIKYFINNERQRKIAYLLAVFSSGLGWTYISKISLDLWNPDFIPMVRFSYFPHMTLATSLLLLSILFFVRSLKENKTKFTILAGFLSFLLNFILPFHQVIAYPITASYALIHFRNNLEAKYAIIKKIFIFFLLSTPSFLYLAYIGKTNAVWSIIEKQNILPTPPIINIILGFGLIFPLCLWGIYYMFKNKKENALFFSLWIFYGISFAYLWFIPMQRRSLETGLYVPIAITASFAVIYIYDRLKKNIIQKTIGIFLLLFFLILGNFNNWTEFVTMIKMPNEPMVYIPKTIETSLKWLRFNTPPNSIILSSFETGQLIPYLSRRISYIGHGPETINLRDKNIETKRFYAGALGQADALNFLEANKINYVLYSSLEKEPTDLKPASIDFLQKIYDENEVEIYQVKL